MWALLVTGVVVAIGLAQGRSREAVEPAGSYARLSTSLGTLWVAFSWRGLRMLHLGGS